MKGSSKVIMGATLAMVIILAFVLALVLVLLLELYCSLLLRRPKPKPTENSSISQAQQAQVQAQAQAQAQAQDQSVPSPLSSFYAQGVLEAPRSFLFPKLPSKREHLHGDDDIEKSQKHGKLHHFLSVQSPNQIGLGLGLGLGLASSSPSPSYIPFTNKAHQLEDEGSCYSGENNEDFMYISNPIYDNDSTRPTRVDTPPFETPDSSPSRLGRSGSSPGPSSPASLPLTPMKELPSKAMTSLALRDCGSDSNSLVGNAQSSSSSGSSYTSPSW